MQIQEAIKNMPSGVLTILGKRNTGKTYLATHTEYPTKKVVWIDVVGAIRAHMCIGERDDIVVIEWGRKVYPKEQLKRALLKIEERHTIHDISMLSRGDMVDAVDLICDFLMFDAPPSTYTLVVDEAGEVIPQERDVYAHRLEAIARMGRNKGVLWLIMTSQRPQKVNKHAVNMSDYYVIFQFIADLDLEAVRRILGLRENEFLAEAKQIKRLGQGSYLLTDGVDMHFNIRKKIITGGENEQREDSGGGAGADSGGLPDNAPAPINSPKKLPAKKRSHHKKKEKQKEQAQTKRQIITAALAGGAKPRDVAIAHKSSLQYVYNCMWKGRKKKKN